MRYAKFILIPVIVLLLCGPVAAQEIGVALASGHVPGMAH
jgi:hypothetical protein